MNWRDEAWQGFRPPYEDEPGDLRRNILDELDDHLQCALKEESESGRHGDDAESAWRAVLERFGHPRRLARRLYLDAIKERIMKDRAMFLGVLVLAAVAIVATVFSWMALQETQRTNQAMVKALESMSLRAGGGASSAPATDLATATIRVVKEREDGEPAAGMSVELNGKFFDDSSRTIVFLTDEKGIATFGPMRPGVYGLNIRKGLSMSFMKDLTLFGAQDLQETVVIPRMTEAAATVSIEWPEDLRDAPPFVGLKFVGRSGEIATTGEWGSEFSVGIMPDGQLCEYDFSRLDPFKGTRLEKVVFPAMEDSIMEFRFSKIEVGLELDRTEQERAKTGPRYRSIISGDLVQKIVFEAKPDDLNEWKLSLPDEILNEIRRKLAEK